MDAEAILEDLFTRARGSDEFEYASTLLRIRGMEDAGWDPLEETAALFQDLTSLLGAPLTDYARIRFGLLLYAHITEVDAIYLMLVNLVEITAGARYSMDPFQDLYGRQDLARYEQIPPSAKRVVARVRERAEANGLTDLAELMLWFFNDQVRNAFFHSDYILFRDEFRSREARFRDENGNPTNSMKLEELVDLINRAIAFFIAFGDVYGRHRGSYTEDKEITGRMGADGSRIPVTLLGSPQGLYGMRG